MKKHIRAALGTMLVFLMIFTLLPVHAQAQTVSKENETSVVVADAALYRLCNPKNNEHLYTTNANEVIVLVSERGWRLESWSGVNGADTGKNAIYRVYNPATGEHLYVADGKERKQLVGKSGWRDEGISFYNPKGGDPVYRLYNPNNKPVASHHYTGNKNEINVLLKNGWKLEGSVYNVLSSESIVLSKKDRSTVLNVIKDVNKKVNEAKNNSNGNSGTVSNVTNRVNERPNRTENKNDDDKQQEEDKDKSDSDSDKGGNGSGNGSRNGSGSGNGGSNGGGSGSGGHWETQIDFEATKDKLERAISDQILSERPTVYIAIDNFVMGADSFILPPTKTQVQKGTTVAKFLQNMMQGRINSTNGGYGFYLKSISGVNAPETLSVDSLPPKIKSSIPANITTLQKSNEEGVLGEFDYTTSSGWMYSVNGLFPNTGMGNYILHDGDVVRVSFTLVGTGADIGGGYAAGGASSGNSVFNNIQAFPNDIKNVAEGGMKVNGLVSKIKNQYN